MSEVSAEDRGIAVAPAPVDPDPQVRFVEPVDPCLNCPCAKAVKAPSLVSRAARRLLSVLHDKSVDTELKKLLPILALRAVVYAGGSVEAAKLVAQALKSAGL